MPLVSLEEAQALVVEACPPLPPGPCALDDALGAVTASPVHATEPVPPFDNTAMDGYALRSADTAGAPIRLRVVGVLSAGAAPDREVGPGEAIRIMTGAPVPPGADAVVMVERTSADPERGEVAVEVEVAPGQHLRRAGDDVRPGDLVVDAGTVLGPAHLGVLASLGVERVEVHPRPTVGVLSTGDELVQGNVELRPGQIRDSNRHTLLALLRQAGFVPVDLGLVPDDEDAITRAVTEGLRRCDALLTSGGVSVGDFDYVKAVLDRLGDMRWMQVAIRPAKPLAFGLVAGRPVFGLPGNPVSSMVSFELFARPALRRLAGHRELHRRPVPAVADDALPRPADGKVHLVRVVASVDGEGRWHARSAGGQGSHQLGAMAAANALAVLPDGEGVAAGALVDLLPLA